MLLEQLGITEEQIQHNVQETLRKLNAISSPAGSDELSAAIAKDVVLNINSTLAEINRSVSRLSSMATHKQTPSTENLVKEVSLKLDAFITGEVPATGQVCSSDKDFNSVLASTVGEAMTVVINTMEISLDEQENNKPTKRCLASIKTVVQILTCQSDCVDICPPHGKDREVNEENKELSAQIHIPYPSMKSFSNEDFQFKAKKVVGDVLIAKMKSFHSAPSSTSCVSASDATSSHDTAVEEFDHLSKLLQPIGETAAGIMEMFIEEIKMIAQSSTDRPCTLDDEEVLPAVPSNVSCVRRNQIQEAVRNIYDKVKMNLRDLFGQLPFQQNQAIGTVGQMISLVVVDHSSHDTTEKPGHQRRCESEQILAVTQPLGAGELRKVHSDCPFSPLLLDTCTKNVLRGVLASYLPGQGQRTSHQGTSPPVPSANSSFEDSLLFYLSDMTSSSSSFFSEDSFSNLSSSLTEGRTSGELNESVAIPSRMNRLNSAEFQIDAFEEVTDVLVTFLQSHTSLRSYASNISSEKDDLTDTPWLDYFAKDLDSVATDVVDGHEDSQTQGTKKVSQIVIQSSETFTGPICPLTLESTTSDVVETVVEGIQTILCSMSGHTMEGTSSDIKGTSERDSQNICKDLNDVMWNSTCEMFRGVQDKVKDFFTKNQQLVTKTKSNTQTYAKEAVSNVLIGIKKDLPISGDLDTVEDVKMIHEVLNSMLNNIREVDDQTEPELTSEAIERPVSSSSSNSLSRWSESSDETLPGTVTITELIAEGTIIKHWHSDSSASVSLAGISRETIASVIKIVNETFGVEDQASVSLQHGGLILVAEKIERSLSRTVVSSRDIVGKIYDLFVKSRKMATRKCVSDTVLFKFGADELLMTKIASQFIQSYAEETVKHFLLPCFNLPLSWGKEKPSSLVPASASVSCPGFTTGMVLDGQDKPEASKVSSDILIDILSLLSEAMVKDVMNSFSLALQSDMILEDSTKQTSKSFNGLGSMTLNEGQGYCSHENAIAISCQKLPQPESNNLDRLITVLMIRLLMRSSNQKPESTDSMENSRQLMGRILSTFDVSKNETHPQDTGTHQLFRAVYYDLLREFGSEMILFKALDTRDSAFDKALVTSLEKQFLKIHGVSESIVPTELTGMDYQADANASQRNKSKKGKKGILRFLRNIPKFNIFRKVKIFL